MSGSRGWALAAAVALLLSGCALQIPSDPEGTLDRVQGGTLRVGVTHNPPWTETEEGDPTGSEPALVADFASRLDADIEWTLGSEESLVADLEHGALDLVIGGFTDRTPWTEQVAMTVPYAEDTGPRGETEKHVMLTRMGENGFLLELERFLLEEGRAP